MPHIVSAIGAFSGLGRCNLFTNVYDSVAVRWSFGFLWPRLPLNKWTELPLSRGNFGYREASCV